MIACEETNVDLPSYGCLSMGVSVYIKSITFGPPQGTLLFILSTTHNLKVSYPRGGSFKYAVEVEVMHNYMVQS